MGYEKKWSQFCQMMFTLYARAVKQRKPLYLTWNLFRINPFANFCPSDEGGIFADGSENIRTRIFLLRRKDKKTRLTDLF